MDQLQNLIKVLNETNETTMTLKLSSSSDSLLTVNSKQGCLLYLIQQT